MVQPHVTPAAVFDLKPEALQCPHIAFDALRSEGPTTWVSELDAFVVTGHADIMSVLRQPTLFSTRHAGGKGNRSQSLPVLLTADPPEHTRQRALVRPAFSPSQIRKIEDYIRELTDQLLDELLEDRPGNVDGHVDVDVLQSFAIPLPMTVIARFLGVDAARIDDFKRWSTGITVFVGNRNPTAEQIAEFEASSREFRDYFLGLIGERRGQAGDDLISVVVNTEIDGDTLSEVEMLIMLSQLLAAGNDTTTNLLGSSLLMLARNQHLYDRLRTEAGFVEKFIEEALRLESPIQGLNRTALDDTVVGGVEIPAGSQVLLLYAGANRDPAEFEDPAELRFDRSGSTSHVAFGYGTHFCIGSSLARAEARIALTRFAARIAKIELAPGAEVNYEPSFLLRGLSALELRLTPA